MLKMENNASIINAFIDLKLHVFSSLLYWKSKTHLTSCEFIKLYKQGLGSANSFLMLISAQKLWTAKKMYSIKLNFLLKNWLKLKLSKYDGAMIAIIMYRTFPLIPLICKTVYPWFQRAYNYNILYWWLPEMNEIELILNVPLQKITRLF